MIFPNDQLVSLVGVVIIPFIVSFMFLKNVMHALTLTWLNEMFFGVGGAWFSVGPISGRAALLFIVLFIYVFAKPNVIYNINRHTRDSLIVFYGTIFPSMLLMYSVIIRGNAFSGAVADVQRFLIIMVYFPLRDLLHRHFSFILGWLACTIVNLSLLLFSLSVAPERFKIILLNNWIFNFGVMDASMMTAILQTGRAALTPVILCMIGVFLGISYTIDSKVKALARLGGVLLLFISIAPFVVNFLRGPIVSMFIIFVMLSIMISGSKGSRILRTFNLMIVVITLISLGYIATIDYIPIALGKWDIRGLEFREMVDPVRIEQTEIMLKAWLEEPTFGSRCWEPTFTTIRVTNPDLLLKYSIQ